MTGLVASLLLAPLLAVLMASTHLPRARRHGSAAALRSTGAGHGRLADDAGHRALPTLRASARGPIWPYVYAALGGFFTMLAMLGGAWWLRPKQADADQFPDAKTSQSEAGREGREGRAERSRRERSRSIRASLAG